MRTGVFMLTLVGLTSIGAYLLGVRWLRLPASALRPALDKMLECIGASLLFAVVNVVLATAAVLVVRAATRTFLSVYMVNDVAWFLLSLAQGLTFHWWRELARERQRSASAP
jgi:hypothetical protein